MLNYAVLLWSIFFLSVSPHSGRRSLPLQPSQCSPAQHLGQLPTQPGIAAGCDNDSTGCAAGRQCQLGIAEEEQERNTASIGQLMLLNPSGWGVKYQSCYRRSNGRKGGVGLAFQGGCCSETSWMLVWMIGGEWLPLHHFFVYMYDTDILYKQYSTFLHFLRAFIKIPHYHVFMRGRADKKRINFTSKWQCRNWVMMPWQI